jgi:hypothetical protein
MTDQEKKDLLAAGIARVLNNKFFVNAYEAEMLAQAFGFCSGAQVLQQKKS